MKPSVAGVGGWVVGLMSVLLAACATPKPPPERAQYDFAPAAEAPVAGPWLAVNVVLPPWLDAQDIAYRLVYDDPARLRQFAGSRWAARPSQLIAARLSNQFAAPASTGAVLPACQLRLELTEFAQHFASPTASHQHLAGRWQISRGAGERLAGGTLRLSEAAGADVAGGVQASARLLTQVADAVRSAAMPLAACAAAP